MAGLDALTDKEKQTLRLIVRGHDAKSAASELDLSVHTINERLRNARRKLDVTSSREAARLLFENELETHENLADKRLGEAPSHRSLHQADWKNGQGGHRIRDWRLGALAIGGLIMFSTLAFVLLASPPAGDAASETGAIVAQEDTGTAAIVTQSKDAALAWLKLVDAEDWQGSFDAAGKAFRVPNTVDAWREASQQARTPLGPVKSRIMAQYEPVDAPPNGFHVVRFRTDFEGRIGVIESVTLEREADGLKVVGYFIN
ncbi:MAG: DUF4019 domain-containing protein [Erythrobacter sp.]|nr:DUF4019 domain-containing protein [Erythrobacter sp.]